MDERDVEGAARRIVEAIKPISKPTTEFGDQQAISARFAELRVSRVPLDEAATQARVEFVARVLREMPERRPAPIGRQHSVDDIDSIESYIEDDGRSHDWEAWERIKADLVASYPAARPGAGEGGG